MKQYKPIKIDKDLHKDLKEFVKTSVYYSMTECVEHLIMEELHTYKRWKNEGTNFKEK